MVTPKRRHRLAVVALALAAVASLATFVPAAKAQDAGKVPAPAASAARTPGPVDSSAPIPPGHPPMNAPAPGAGGAAADGDHDDDPHGGHGAGGGGAPPGVFEAKPDVVDEDSRIPAGTIVVEIVDPEGKPLPRTSVTLGVLHNSVAQGERRERVQRDADDTGKVTFDNLQTGSGIAYRVSVAKDGGSFAASPFPLSRDKGMRVVLHVYPVTHKVVAIDKLANLTPEAVRGEALIVIEAILYAELKDDRIQLQQLFRIVNPGVNAWVPKDVVPALPVGFTALTNGTQEMSDIGIDPEARGPRLRGTFGPGKHEVTFRWQLPFDNDKDVSFDVGMPPNVVSMRVMAAASDPMRLVVDGYPASEPQADGQGQRVLVTERQLRRGDSLISNVKVSLHDLPVIGPERVFVTAFAAFTVLVGLVIAVRNRRPDAVGTDDAKARRALLLADLEELERAHRDGDIGPKTYERARRQLVDAIARTLAKRDTAETRGAREKPRAGAKAARDDESNDQA